MQVSVYRYNPETDDRPYMSDFTVDIPKGRDLMVLDVMALIKEQDPSVTYRRSCREGVCGSDGVNMNGKKRSGVHHAGIGSRARGEAEASSVAGATRCARLGR